MTHQSVCTSFDEIEATYLPDTLIKISIPMPAPILPHIVTIPAATLKPFALMLRAEFEAYFGYYEFIGLYDTMDEAFAAGKGHGVAWVEPVKVIDDTTPSYTVDQVKEAFIKCKVSQIYVGGCEDCHTQFFYITDGERLGLDNNCNCASYDKVLPLRPWSELVTLAENNPSVAAQLELESGEVC